MNTELVGIKDFRANVATYVKKARSGTKRVFVMNRNKPLFEIKPFKEEDGMDALLIELAQRKKEITDGNFKTSQEVMAMFD